MRMRLRVAMSTALLVLISVGCSGEGSGGEGGEPEADVAVTFAIGQEPPGLDPQARDDGFARAVNANVYEGLLDRTPTGELIPSLATVLPERVADDRWQFQLREDVEFHNGEPFNADAVVESVRRILDPELASEQLSFFTSILGAEKVDEFTVDIITDGPDSVLPARMYWMVMVPPNASSQVGFDRNPVGTGPYAFAEWVQGDHITIERNDAYWGENPSNIDVVTYRFVPEGGTRVAGVLSGEFDLITNLFPEDMATVPKFAAVEGLEHPFISLDAMSGPTKDVRVRQALNYAVDKESLASELFGGFAQVDTCQILSPSWLGYNESLEPYPYDPDLARELIKEAGAEGATIELVGTAGRWLKDQETINAVANFWREVGLEVDIQMLPFGEYNTRGFHGGVNPPMAMYRSSSNELLDADRSLSAYYEAGGIAATNDSEEAAGAIQTARQEADPAVREELYAEATRIGCEEAFHVFLLNNQDVYGMSETFDWSPRVDARLYVKEMKVER